MTKVNMLEAKSNLSKLVEAVESGAEAEIIIARNGKPAARLVPLETPAVDVSKRLGIAEGEFDFDYAEWAEWKKESRKMWDEWLAEPIDPDERAPKSPRRRKRA